MAAVVCEIAAKRVVLEPVYVESGYAEPFERLLGFAVYHAAADHPGVELASYEAPPAGGYEVFPGGDEIVFQLPPFGLQGSNVKLQYGLFFGIGFGPGHIPAFEINIEGFAGIFVFFIQQEGEIAFSVCNGFRQQ